MSNELEQQKKRLINLADKVVKQLDYEISDNGNIEGALHYINALSGIYSLLDRLKAYEEVHLVSQKPVPTNVEVDSRWVLTAGKFDDSVGYP